MIDMKMCVIYLWSFYHLSQINVTNLNVTFFLAVTLLPATQGKKIKTSFCKLFQKMSISLTHVLKITSAVAVVRYFYQRSAVAVMRSHFYIYLVRYCGSGSQNHKNKLL